MKKNIGLIIATVIIIAVVVATISVAIFAGAVALFGYVGETESGTQQVEEVEGGAENLGGDESGSQSVDQGGNQSGNVESTPQESIRDEAEFGGAVTGVEMPEPDEEFE